ncbi:MAG: PH domain-containing protein, partial [Actinobacteria bacterium]|nr:PH domain-containing protein [Actinomycetota bacterium]
SQVTVSSAGTDGEIQLRYLSVERAERFTAAVLSAAGRRHRAAAAVSSTPPRFDPAQVIDARVVDPTAPTAPMDPMAPFGHGAADVGGANVGTAGLTGPPRRLLHQVELDELWRSVWNSLWWIAPVSIVLVVVGGATEEWGVLASPLGFVGLGVRAVFGQTIGRYNLRVELDDQSVRTTAGLTTVKHTSSRLQRLQVLYATTTWLQRRRRTERIEYASADATANDEESGRENALAFDVAEGTWQRFAVELLRRPVLGTAARPADFQRRPRAAITVSVLRWSIAAAVLGLAAFAAWVSVPLAFEEVELERSALPMVVTAVVCALMVGYGTYRGWRLAAVNVWATDEDDLLVRSGLLRRRTLLAPRVKVQAVRVTQGPLQRRFGLASVRVNLAPLDGSLSPWIADISSADAQRLSEALARSASTPLPAGV